MNYYLEKISKKRQQLEIAKIGFTQKANSYIHNAQNCKDEMDYDYAKEMVETLNAGLELVKEIEKEIDFLYGKFKEEQEKEKSEEDKK